MTMREVEPILSNVLLAFQLSLGLWQFTKLTPVGAFIQGVFGYLLYCFCVLIQGVYGYLMLHCFRREEGRGIWLLNATDYARLKYCNGRVFKRACCYVLEGADNPSERTGYGDDYLEGADIPSERTRDGGDVLGFCYLGSEIRLEKSGSVMNCTWIDGKMSYYVNTRVWQELGTLTIVLKAAAATEHVAAAANFARYRVMAVPRGNFCTSAITLTSTAVDVDAIVAASAASAADKAAAAAAAAAPSAAAVDAATSSGGHSSAALFVKGRKDFWQEVMTGGVMSLDEVLDGIILNNQRVSVRQNEKYLLPVNLSVSEEKLLKILNLVGLFLQTKKVKVPSLVPTSLSIVSALLEFCTPLRVWLYNHINLVFSSLIHFMCDPLPRSWRRQIYSLGKWIENVTPGNDIEMKIERRANFSAIITGSAKVEKQGATLVTWLTVNDGHTYSIEIESFRCNPIHITCEYFVLWHTCQINAPTISVFQVECKSKTEFEKIVTLVSCIAKNRCGSLKCCGPNNKVSVRGFKESVTSYVKDGLPPILELVLEDVVVN